MSQSDTATFALRIDADKEAPAEAAAALEKYRATIQKSQGAIAEYAQATRLLRGTSDEVKDAKAKLKAAIEAERASITKANLEVLKLGGSYAKLAKAAKDSKAQQDGVKKAVSAIGAPAKELTEKVGTLKDILGGATSGWGALAGGVSAGLVVLALAAASVAGLTVKFTEWLATTADANRNLALTREAFSGNVANAKAWGNVLDWASEKTALTTAQMNDLVVSTEKTYRGFRISGQGMVDAFKASAAAAGAGRPDVAAFFDEVISRGKMTGRAFVGFTDFARFRNAGVDVTALYKELGISAANASRGAVVSTDKMAAALRKLSESRFAEINGKKMLGLGFQWDHLTDNLMRFTNDLTGAGGALEPLLKAIASVAQSFDLSTESGQNMKRAVTEYGTVLAGVVTRNLPLLKGLVSAGIEVVSWVIRAAAAVVAFGQSSTGLFLIKTVLVGIGMVVAVLVAGVAVLGAGFAILATPIVLAAAAIVGLWEAGKKLLEMDWGSLGRAIVDGLVGGITAGWDRLKTAVVGMGEGVKNEFKKILGIASPSKVFARMGVDTTGGYVEGIKKTTPAVSRATQAMGDEAVGGAAAVVATSSEPTPAQGAPAARGGGGGLPPIEVNVVIHGGGGGAQELAAMVRSESVLGPLRQALRTALQGAGIPTGVPTPAGG